MLQLSSAPSSIPMYSLSSLCGRARIIRWDREGAIVTSAIDYNNEPDVAEFFHRYSRASPEMCGVDTSVTLAGDEEANLARSRLNIPSTICMFKVDVPNAEGSGSLTLVFPQPVTKSHSPVGRWMHACPAFDLVNKKLVMFKDSWWVSLPDVLPEGKTYRLLMLHNVSHIPKCIAFHDVPLYRSAIYSDCPVRQCFPTYLSLRTLFTVWPSILWAKF